MQIKVFSFDKWKESPEQFEKRVNDWIQSTGDISLQSVEEHKHSGDIIFIFKSSGEKKSIDQELCLIAWSDLETLEGAVNNALSGVAESGRNAKHINLVTTSKSRRALAVFVVEGRSNLSSSGPEQSEADDGRAENPKKGNQDQAIDVKPKRRRKSKIVA